MPTSSSFENKVHSAHVYQSTLHILGIIFTAMLSAVLATAFLSICLSVHLSHAGIVSKQMNVG